MRPNWTRIHPKKGNSNKCAIPSKPKDSVSQLESFRVFFNVVLMEINVWNWLAIFPVQFTGFNTYGNAIL